MLYAGTLFQGELQEWVTTRKNGLQEIDLIISGLSITKSVSTIENALEQLPNVLSVRVNLTGKRLVVTWEDASFNPNAITEALHELGFTSRPYDPSNSGFVADDAQSRMLLRAVAISGFAASNIMLLSVSVWSGADGATRDLFHWISAAIALPTVAYAGRPFFRSAARALSSGQFNMDVPISLAVCLAAMMSLYESSTHGEVAYFDASVTLLFFLLTGRYLDHLMKAKARSAVSQLLSLASSSAMVIDENGVSRLVATSTLQSGMKMLVAAGERFAADGVVISGASEIDRSLVTGEANPESVKAGSQVHAGMINLTGLLRVSVTAAGQDTFLSEIIRLMASAEQGRSRFVQIADKLARVYAPSVHVLSAFTLVSWLVWTGGDWHSSLMTAIAVLIITCPCALGLAVPAVQTVASGVLFRNGVMIKDGAALEKLSAIDTVIFDKTGTLSRGHLRLVASPEMSLETLALAAGLAQSSRHPLSKSLSEAAHAEGIKPLLVESIEEIPGCGLLGNFNGETIKLGSRAWCGFPEDESQGLPEFVLAQGSQMLAVFAFEDELREDAEMTIASLRSAGLNVEILSGDREAAVRHTAQKLGVERWQAGVTPQEKLSYICSLKDAG